MRFIKHVALYYLPSHQLSMCFDPEREADQSADPGEGEPRHGSLEAETSA